MAGPVNWTVVQFMAPSEQWGMRVSVAPAVAGNKDVRHTPHQTRAGILTVNGQRRELKAGASELEVLWASRGGEGRRLVDGGLRNGDNIRTVNQVCTVVSEDGELGHGSLEARGHELLLVDEALPEASRALVAGESEVGLETQLARVSALCQWKWGQDFAEVTLGSGDANTLKQHLQEHLSVESERSL